MKLFLDDIRNPIECLGYMRSRIGKKSDIYADNDWIVVSNYLEFTMALLKYEGEFTLISFDHDLALTHYDNSNFKESFQYQEETCIS